MDEKNETAVREFILVGQLHLLHQPTLIFSLLFIVYMMSLAGNSLIISIVKLDARLHSPMYFFLCNLSILEIFYTSTTIPTILSISLTQEKRLSVASCLSQIYFLHFLGVTECLLLAAMAYDRYLAICRPLHYRTMMKGTVCLSLAIICWLSGMLESLILTFMTSRLLFCGPKTIANFFCDIPPLLKLACMDTHVNELVLSLAGGLVVLLPFLFILLTYVWIISTILKIRSAQGRQKAFSTCASHLTVVGIFYGTVIFMYVRPSSLYSSDRDKLVSLVYTVFTPMLNPLIYSLRNNDVKRALKKVFNCKISSHTVKK
uniref:Olfactory receptor n=1 Tax=Geotrypetes seraphini TaxID=260995 RepID=A0A6P8PYM7_GEOSA|nr:olfactory receptor 6N1-like [Geotrypetes seraphini]XP_033779896.1 olfactory receptor 6N1-like [Geotrypetes seraphini]XP_033779905.1 olfactory receptor 6N1-like [Geotrypetes seraphini]